MLPAGPVADSRNFPTFQIDGHAADAHGIEVGREKKSGAVGRAGRAGEEVGAAAGGPEASGEAEARPSPPPAKGRKKVAVAAAGTNLGDIVLDPAIFQK